MPISELCLITHDYGMGSRVLTRTVVKGRAAPYWFCISALGPRAHTVGFFCIHLKHLKYLKSLKACNKQSTVVLECYESHYAQAKHLHEYPSTVDGLLQHELYNSYGQPVFLYRPAPKRHLVTFSMIPSIIIFITRSQ